MNLTLVSSEHLGQPLIKKLNFEPWFLSSLEYPSFARYGPVYVQMRCVGCAHLFHSDGLRRGLLTFDG